MISLFSKIFSSRKSKSKRQPANAFSFPNQLSLQKLEDRITPAIGSLVGSTLTIDYTATGTTAETVTATNDGTNITLTGDITGITSFTTSNITKISITNSGTSTNQTFNLDGSAGYVLQSGLSSAGVDFVNITTSIDSSTGLNANITVSDATSIYLNADISSGSGNITLDADTGTNQPGNITGVFING
ncbi:MAG: hypothetical protein ACO3GX_16165, partial [Gemmataceae bacterium]